MGSSNAIETDEPELEEGHGAPGEGDDGDGGEGDEPGWLITYVDGKQQAVIHLEGTPDDGLSTADVFEKFHKARRAGNLDFVLGHHCARMDLIRSLSWSESVDLPEITIFDTLQERVEGMLEAVEEAARNTVFLQQQQAALQQAQAQLFTAIDAESTLEGEGDEDEPEEAAPEPAPPQRLRHSGKKLPPGVRR